MANLFFAREGRDPNRSSQGIHMEIADVIAHFSNEDRKHFNGPPLINADKTPSPFSNYTLVVVEVETGETSVAFPDIGYYYLPNMAPIKCAEILGIKVPQ